LKGGDFMPQDDIFLRTFFIDCQKAMRKRMETEYRLLNMFIILYPAIITAVFGIKRLLENEGIFLELTISMAAFLTVLAISLTVKIKAEHKIYEDIGHYVVKIWEYFCLFEKGAYIQNDTILDKKARKYGKGKGYLKTIYILWAMTLMTDFILIAIGFAG
jgi:hypothetical protein